MAGEVLCERNIPPSGNQALDINCGTWGMADGRWQKTADGNLTAPNGYVTRLIKYLKIYGEEENLLGMNFIEKKPRWQALRWIFLE